MQSDRKYFDKVKKIFTYGTCPIEISPQISFFDDNLKVDSRKNKFDIEGKEYEINGWIGYVDKSDDLKEGAVSLNKISILTNGTFC